MQISTGSIDITPQKPIPLFGFAERSGVFSKIKDNLEINLSVLRIQDSVILLYSVDTLFVPGDFVQTVVGSFGTKYGFDEKQVWMTSSHTHFAPSLDAGKPGLGAFNETYYRFVLDRLLTLTEKVLAGATGQVELSYGNTKSVLNVNRRKKLWRPAKGFGIRRKILMYPNYSGVKDDNIHLVKFSGNDGTPQLIIWNYACHPVGNVHRHEVTAEYIGWVRKELRKYYNNPNLTVIFMLGFAGNLKPDITAVTHTRAIDKIRYFFQLKPKYTRFPSTSVFAEWCNCLWEEVKSAVDNTSPVVCDSVTCTAYSIKLAEIIGDDYNHRLHFRKMQFGNDLIFIGISAEVLAEYSSIIHRMFAGKQVITVGCLPDTRLYLPADRNVLAGGYEAHGFKHRFHIKGDFVRGIEKRIKEAITHL